MSIIRKSIGGLISDIAQTNSDRDALVHAEADQRYSYQDLAHEIDRAARGFLYLGIRPGDKLALWSANVPEWMVAFLGLAKLGAITVPIDPAATTDNLYYILEQSESRGLIVADSDDSGGMLATASAAKSDIPLLEQIIVINGTSDPIANSWNELIAAGENTAPDTLAKISGGVNPEDPVAIMYTSGTTGQPKGVVLDHLGLINKSMVSTDRQGISADDKLCLFFPLFHMFGNTCIALAGLLRGAALIMPCRSFDPARVLAAIPGEKCTAIYGSPSMLIALIDNPKFAQDDWTTLSKGIIGGAPCPMELMRRIVEDIGVSDITVAYGITETSSWITMTHPADAIELRVSTIGRPLACNEVKIVDPASGQELATGQQGELCTRGFLMQEYYRMPAATAAAVDRDKWFHTGDLGMMDPDGYVRISGRVKDVIVRNNIELYPVEIEETIYMLPDISEVQVFGFPDQNKGQEVAAWIKLKENSKLSLDAVAAHVRAQLPVEQHPKYYKIVSEFPMTGSGKVQKFKMALLAEEEYLD
jgi:acyl-CoA synthetase (AMP-forming)/AMP-acid ligase II